jgi:hypothetical protein
MLQICQNDANDPKPTRPASTGKSGEPTLASSFFGRRLLDTKLLLHSQCLGSIEHNKQNSWLAYERPDRVLLACGFMAGDIAIPRPQVKRKA